MFPALEGALDVTNTGPLKLLTGYQAPAAIRRAGVTRLTTWLANRKVRGTRALAETAVEAAGRRHTAIPGEKTTAKLVHTLAGEVMTLNEQIREMDKLIGGPISRARTRRHHLERPWHRSDPRCRVSRRRRRRPGQALNSPDALAAFALAPRDSGKVSGNLRRLQRVFYTSALVSVQFDPNLWKFYDRKRAEGKKRVQAVLALARRVDVLWALVRDRWCYQVAPPAAAAA